MARKAWAAFGSLLFLVLAPGIVAGLVPWWISRWEIGPSGFGHGIVRVAGAVLLAAGILGLLDSFARFAIQGIGTPAPVFPTRRLVVKGLYRHVRNPMYVAVVALILGQALVFGNWRLFAYAALIWLCFHAFVVAYEEPTLRKSFGAEYETYRANVPRWLPRLRPWRAG